MQKIQSDPGFKKSLIKLALPIVGTEVINALLMTLNTLIGGFSTLSTQVVGPVTRIYFLFFGFLLAFIFTGNLFISQYYGRGNLEKVEKVYYLLLKLAAALAVFFLVFSEIFSKELVSLFIANNDPEIVNYSSKYLQLFAISFFFTGISLSNYCLMKNIRLERFALFNVIGTIVIYVTLDCWFIYFPFYNDPVLGGSLAMIIARFLEFASSFIIFKLKANHYFNFSFKKFVSFDNDLFKQFVKYGTPIFISKVAFGIGSAWMSISLSQLGSGPIMDANGLMNGMRDMTVCITDGFASVVGIVIGRELGANRTAKAKYHGDLLTRYLHVVAWIAMGVFILTFGVNYGIILLRGEEISEELIKSLLILYAVNVVMLYAQTFNTSFINGFFSAGGDTIFIMIVELVTFFGIAVPLCYIGTSFNWNTYLIIIITQCSELYKLPINIVHFIKRKWVKNVINTKGIVFVE